MSGYIGVNGVARKIKKVYMGVDGVAREVKKMYVGVDGVAKKWWSSFTPPNKSDIVKMNLDGTERYYKILSVNGNICKVMGMFDDLNSQYNATSTTITMGSITVQKYENSTLDTYLNTTWYNALSTEAKNAIIPESILCDAWYYSASTASGSPVYNGTYGTSVPGTSNYSIGKYTGGTLSISNRKVFALGVQDVIDYLSDDSVKVDTSAILRNVNIWKMFWNDEVSHSGKYLCLRSSNAATSGQAFCINGNNGTIGPSGVAISYVVRPIFNLDMSKISYTIASADENIFPAVSSYTVTPYVTGASYGFTLNSSGYYESNNKAVNNSAAVCRVNLNLAAKSNITFTCINYAESNYDFGLLGNVDSALDTTNTVDSSVAKSFKGSSQAGTQTYTYSNVAAGTHFIDVKFRKDSSVNNNNDSLQFKVTIANA